MGAVNRRMGCKSYGALFQYDSYSLHAIRVFAQALFGSKLV
jgi:hypothetical protein